MAGGSTGLAWPPKPARRWQHRARKDNSVIRTCRMGKEVIRMRAESLMWEVGWVAMPASLYP